jgi:hypothetical protein
LNYDSTFTVLTTVADSISGPGFDYGRICLIKFNQDGTEIWRKKYGRSIAGNYVHNIKLLPDSGYICVGTQSPDNFDIAYVGWMMRLDKKGDSIWFRQYTYNQDNHPFHHNSLNDVDMAPDGGFIATGQAFDNFPPNTLQKIWVLKLDSIGCDTAGCDPTVGVADMETRRKGDKEIVLEVWPNPCSTVLYFSLTSRQSAVGSRQSNERLNIEIFDIFGRKVNKTLISSPMEGGGNMDDGRIHALTMDVSSLPPGLYIAVVKDERSLVGSAKFVVSR